jgi:hypothetical protein
MPAPITIAGFAGASAAIDPHQLDPTIGVNAVDMEPGRDRFVPLAARVNRATVPSGRLAIYRMGRDVVSATEYWLSSTAAATYARFFGANPTEKTLIAGDGELKWTDNTIGLGAAPYPQSTRPASVPAPTNPPTVTEDTAGTGDDGTRYYVQTFVNDLGWESAPSPPSAAFVCKPGAIVDLSDLGAPPAGSYGFTTRRIYVTQPGLTGATEFYFILEQAVASTTAQDTNQPRGALLATYDGTVGSSWLPAPTDAFAVLALWAGMHAVLTVDKLHISVPDAPYAYPDKNAKTLKAKGVALAKWGQNLAVLTTAEPVIYQGLDPQGMAPLPAALNHPCRSARGVVSFADGICWPSNDGLAWIGNDGQAILTAGVLTPEQWRALDPSTMVAGRWRDFYVCSFNDGTLRGFIINPKAPNRIFWLSTGFDACHYDELAQALFVLEGINVREFAAGAALTASFTSKRFLQVRPQNYGCAKVIADAYPVTLTVRSRWHDPLGVAREVVDTRSVPGPAPFSLKSGFKAESVQVEVSAAVPVLSVRLAGSARDLAGL